jgi:hypothetical protein
MQYPETILSQFINQPHYKGILDSYIVECVELRAAFEDLKTLKSIDDSIGEQLDLIGELVGITRKGWDDATYRTWLRIQIFLNGQNSTVEDLITIFDPAEIIDRSTAITVRDTIGDLTEAQIKSKWELLQRSKAAGVKGDFMYGAPDVDQFKLDVSEMPALISYTEQTEPHIAIPDGIQSDDDTVWFMSRGHYVEFNFITKTQVWYDSAYAANNYVCYFFDPINRNIWRIPYTGTQIVYFNVDTHTETAILHGLTGSNFYKSYIYDSDLQKLICVPYHTNKIMTVDLNLCTLTLFEFTPAVNYDYFYGGVKASTGDYWFAPYGSPNILRFTGTSYYNYAHGQSVEFGVSTGIVQYKNKLYTCPYYCPHMLSVDLTNNSITEIDWPRPLTSDTMEQIFVTGREIVIAGYGLFIFDTLDDSWRTVSGLSTDAFYTVYKINDSIFYYSSSTSKRGIINTTNGHVTDFKYPFTSEYAKGVTLADSKGVVYVAYIYGIEHYAFYLMSYNGADYQAHHLNNLYSPTKNLLTDSDFESLNLDNWVGVTKVPSDRIINLSVCGDTGTVDGTASVYNTSYKLLANKKYQVDFWIKCISGNTLSLTGDTDIFYQTTVIQDVWNRITRIVKPTQDTYLYVLLTDADEINPPLVYIPFVDDNFNISTSTHWVGSGVSEVTKVASPVYEGTRALKLHWPYPTIPLARYANYASNLPIVAGHAYIFKGRVMRKWPDSVAPDFGANFVIKQNGNTIYSRAWILNNWLPFSINFVAQSSADVIQFGTNTVVERFDSNLCSDWYFDQFQIFYEDFNAVPETYSQFQIDDLKIYLKE